MIQFDWNITKVRYISYSGRIYNFGSHYDANYYCLIPYIVYENTYSWSRRYRFVGC
jgi:hypothetical protein